MKTKNVKSKSCVVWCDDGHEATGFRFVCPGSFVGEMPLTSVQKVGGVKRVKEVIVAYLNGGSVPSELTMWLEDGKWEAAV